MLIICSSTYPLLRQRIFFTERITFAFIRSWTGPFPFFSEKHLIRIFQKIWNRILPVAASRLLKSSSSRSVFCACDSDPESCARSIFSFWLKFPPCPIPAGPPPMYSADLMLLREVDTLVVTLQLLSRFGLLFFAPR